MKELSSLEEKIISIEKLLDQYQIHLDKEEILKEIIKNKTDRFY